MEYFENLLADFLEMEAYFIYYIGHEVSNTSAALNITLADHLQDVCASIESLLRICGVLT